MHSEWDCCVTFLLSSICIAPAYCASLPRPPSWSAGLVWCGTIYSWDFVTTWGGRGGGQSRLLTETLQITHIQKYRPLNRNILSMSRLHTARNLSYPDVHRWKPRCTQYDGDSDTTDFVYLFIALLPITQIKRNVFNGVTRLSGYRSRHLLLSLQRPGPRGQAKPWCKV